MITLTYLRGHQLVLVNTDPPADSGELPELMWRLQTAGARYGFTISVTDADAFTTQAPPIRAWSLRPKAGSW